MSLTALSNSVNDSIENECAENSWRFKVGRIQVLKRGRTARLSGGETLGGG